MRTLATFRNIHQGETIIVCGCGESLNYLREPQRFITIGVNDIGRRFHPNYLVVLNPREQFTGDRFQYIKNSRTEVIFTQLDLGIPHPNIVKFRLGKSGGIDLTDPDVLHYTQNSPYVAVCLAAHMGAKRIGLIGVDFSDNHFFGKNGSHPLNHRLSKVKEEYADLANALTQHNVELVNLSQKSRLDSIPKKHLALFCSSTGARLNSAANYISTTLEKSSLNPIVLSDSTKSGDFDRFKHLRVVHVAKTNCAGALWNLHHILKKYTEIQSRVITASNKTSGFKYPMDVLLSDQRSVAEIIEEVDLIHFHNWIDNGSPEMSPYRKILDNKPAVLQFHSEPSLLRPVFPGRDPAKRHDILTLVVAQKHVRFFPNAIPVPNAIDISDPIFKPNEHEGNDILRILFTPTDTKAYGDYISTCRGKGYAETVSVLRDLEKKGVVCATIRTGVPREELMHLRQQSDIIIDECVTGGYHLTSLEGLAQGLATLAFLDQETLNTICKITDSPVQELPWVNTPIGRLKETILFLADNPIILKTYRRAGRPWMEKYWNPKIIIQHYLNAYEKALNGYSTVFRSKISWKYDFTSQLKIKDRHNRELRVDLNRTRAQMNVQKSENNGDFYYLSGSTNPRRSEDYPQAVRLMKELLSEPYAVYLTSRNPIVFRGV